MFAFIHLNIQTRINYVLKMNFQTMDRTEEYFYAIKQGKRAKLERVYHTWFMFRTQTDIFQKKFLLSFTTTNRSL